MLRNGFDRKKAWETCRGSNTSLQAILALGKPAEPPRVRAFLISELAFARAQRIRREGMRARLCQRRERGRQSSSSGKNQNRDSFRGEKSGKESGPTFVALTCGTAAASVPACSAPNPSAAGEGTSLVVSWTPPCPAALSNPVASVLTRSWKPKTSAYGEADGSDG